MCKNDICCGRFYILCESGEEEKNKMKIMNNEIALIFCFILLSSEKTIVKF